MKVEEIVDREFWDKRAVNMLKRLDNEDSHQENETRCRFINDFLLDEGLYNGDSKVLDIGCGPGRLTAMMARKAKSVTGLDVSLKMIDSARKNAEHEGLTNVDFLNEPWQSIDLKGHGLEGAYDLVFASLCPGVGSEAALLKMSQASRGWCFTCSYVSIASDLKDQVRQHIFGAPGGDGLGYRKESYGKSFTQLLTTGYYPYVSYHDTNLRSEWPVDDKTATHFAGFLGPIDQEKENIFRYKEEVMEYLKSIADNDLVVENTLSRILFLFWKVK